MPLKLPIELDKNSRQPIYHQIEKQLQALIAGSHLAANSPLPSIRVLSKDLGVSVITTRRAYQNLEYAGFIKTIQGKGTYVAEVDQVVIDATKKESVEEAFTTAIQTAINYDYSVEQIKSLVSALLKDKKGGR